MTTYTIGDIHGRHNALIEVLKKCKFDYEKDKLIVLGDAVDGGRDTNKVLDELLKIQHLVFVLGNHDVWALEWMKTGDEFIGWVHQGGYATMESYGFDHNNVPQNHTSLLENAQHYYLDDENRVYCHGGFNPAVPIEKQTVDFVTWNRKLWVTAKNRRSTKPLFPYKYAFIGHTTTQLMEKTDKPLTYDKVVCLDTGAGWNGKLTIMNVDTFEYWQSKKQEPSHR